mgnify:FL=1
MKWWALALLLVVGMGHRTLSAQQLDNDHGFMGIQLGAEKDSLLTTMVQKRGVFQRLNRFDLLPEYLQFNDILLEAPIDLRYVRVFFWDGHIHSIEVKALAGQGDKLRQYIMDRYGEGQKEDAMGYKFTWEEPKTLLIMEQNLVTKDVHLMFRDHRTHVYYYRHMYFKKYGNPDSK